MALDVQGTLVRVYEGASLRISTAEATYATGVAGIRIVSPNQFFDNIEVFVDEGLITTPAPTSAPMSTAAPTTPAPTSAPVEGISGLGYSVVAFPSGSSAMGTLTPDGVVHLKAGSTATDILTDGCWDPDGNVYFAYKVGAAVRIARYDGRDALASADWDVALVTMQSTDGRAMLDWHGGSLWVWVHNVSTESNQPQIYEVNQDTGAVVGGVPWSGPSRTPSAAVDQAAPGGSDFGYYPAIRVSDNRIWLLGMATDRTGVYLEVINKGSKAQVSNITLQSEAGPDELWARGLDVDPINEYCFVHWGHYNDGSGDDEVNRASYEMDGSVRWSSTSPILNWTFMGGVAYDVNNDQLYVGGGTNNFNNTDESISVVNPATGARTSGSVAPNAGATALNVGMYAPDDGILLSNGGTIFRYTTALTNPEEWSLVLAATSRVMRTDYLYSSAVVSGGPTTPAPASTPVPVTTEVPTTLPEPSFPVLTTPGVLTTAIGSTTGPPVTVGPTTPAPTSSPGTTEAPTVDGTCIQTSISYVDSQDQLVVRAWLENDERKVRDEDLAVTECELELLDERGVSIAFGGVVDGLGTQYVRFVVPNARLYANHLYMLEATLVVDGGPTVGPSAEPFPVI